MDEIQVIKEILNILAKAIDDLQKIAVSLKFDSDLPDAYKVNIRKKNGPSA